MASEMETPEYMTQNKTTNFWPRSERKLQKRLRNTGQEYVSRSGKIIPAKKQPEVLCQCPQKCGDKIPQDVRQKLFTEFYILGDHALQNEFLMAHIEIRAVQRRSSDHKTSSGRNQRRVSCKYHIPLLTDAGPPIGSCIKSQIQTVEVCQKAFMHVYAITEKRVRLQREKLICQYGIEFPALSSHPMKYKDSVDSARYKDSVNSLWQNEPIDLTSRKRDPPPMIPIIMKAPDKDIAIVHNFFLNQLWKPEYIGTAT